MSNDQLASRMIANQADVPGNKLKSGFLDSNDWASLRMAEESLENSGVEVYMFRREDVFLTVREAEMALEVRG